MGVQDVSGTARPGHKITGNRPCAVITWPPNDAHGCCTRRPMGYIRGSPELELGYLGRPVPIADGRMITSRGLRGHFPLRLPRETPFGVARAIARKGVIAGGSRIPSATVVWTAEVAASSIPKMLGTETDRAGRAVVDPFLRVVGAPGVFVVGDAASVMQNEHPVPGVAQAAIQEGGTYG